MNSVEPSGLLYSRLSCLDPESASKTMGFVLIHGLNEADMMSLATAPDAVLQQLISKGKSYSRVLTSSLQQQHSPTASSSPRFPINLSSSPRQIPATTSYAAAVVNGNGNGPSSATASSSLFHHACGDGEVAEDDDVYASSVPEALTFLSRTDDLCGGSPRSAFHKRSLSLTDAYSNGGGLDELRPGAGAGAEWRPWKFDGFEQEVLRSRATQQQRLALASQIMSGTSFPYSKHFSDTPRSKAAAMMMGEEAYRLAQLRNERSDLGMMGCSSGSRQIYLTFPADSTFREEDVSNYFSIYGPVQDVRIPYQQKRMFGFVTFVHPETVKIILAKGNPHFVCDSRVLVKPYKEKGKVEKKHLMTQQQLESGDLSSCLSPHGVDIRDFDVPIGPRMFYNSTQDLLMRRKLEEQAEFQQALEMQSRKMANLQLMDLKNISRRHPFSPNHNLSPAAALSSPTHHPLLSPNHMRSMGSFNQDTFEENNITPTLSLPPHAFGNRQNALDGYSNANNCNERITSNTNEIRKPSDSEDNESIDLVLPDTLDDTIPSRPAVPSRHSIFSSAMLAMNEDVATTNSQFPSNNCSTTVSSACLSNVAFPKSRFLDDPRCSMDIPVSVQLVTGPLKCSSNLQQGADSA